MCLGKSDHQKHKIFLLLLVAATTHRLTAHSPASSTAAVRPHNDLDRLTEQQPSK